MPLRSAANNPVIGGLFAVGSACFALGALPGYAQAVRLLGCADIFQDLRLLTVPTLVLCGASDQITPPEHVARIAEAVPAATRARREMPLLIDGAGHALPQEKPDELAAPCAALMIPTTEQRHARAR